jgi:hypothetical protein
MVQLIVAARKVDLPDQPAILGGSRIDVNHTHGVALSIVPDVEKCHIREVFWRSLHCHAR